jgi:hypothetical protein
MNRMRLLSSMMTLAGYDPANRVLEIEFATGAVHHTSMFRSTCTGAQSMLLRRVGSFTPHSARLRLPTRGGSPCGGVAQRAVSLSPTRCRDPASG